MQIVEQHANQRIGTVRSLLLCAWFDEPKTGQIARLLELAGGLSPRPCACVNVVVQGRPAFSETIRGEARAFMREQQAFGVGVAHAILAPGLVATATRAFLHTAMLLVRPATDTRIFDDLAPAAQWLAERYRDHGQIWAPDVIREAAQRVAALP